MYCRKCGKEIKDDNFFCMFCGTKTSGSDFYSTPDKTLEAKKIAHSKRKKAKVSKITFLCSLGTFTITFLLSFLLSFPIYLIVIFSFHFLTSLISGAAWIGYTSDIPESEQTEREEKFISVTSFISDLLDFFKD